MLRTVLTRNIFRAPVAVGNVARQSFAYNARFLSTVSMLSQAKTSAAISEVENGQLEPSEPFQEVSSEHISGAPADLSRNRIVRIYQKAKPATQSGQWGTTQWRLDWEIVNRANRWENDMMGWPSSGDYMQATEIKFRTREDAIQFAVGQGWDYYIQEPHKRKFRKKVYAVNFEHSVGELKHIRTK